MANTLLDILQGPQKYDMFGNPVGSTSEDSLPTIAVSPQKNNLSVVAKQAMSNIQNPKTPPAGSLPHADSSIADTSRSTVSKPGYASLEDIQGIPGKPGLSEAQQFLEAHNRALQAQQDEIDAQKARILDWYTKPAGVNHSAEYKFLDGITGDKFKVGEGYTPPATQAQKDLEYLKQNEDLLKARNAYTGIDTKFQNGATVSRAPSTDIETIVAALKQGYGGHPPLPKDPNVATVHNSTAYQNAVNTPETKALITEHNGIKSMADLLSNDDVPLAQKMATIKSQRLGEGISRLPVTLYDRLKNIGGLEGSIDQRLADLTTGNLNPDFANQYKKIGQVLGQANLDRLNEKRAADLEKASEFGKDATGANKILNGIYPSLTDKYQAPVSSHDAAALKWAKDPANANNANLPGVLAKLKANGVM